MRFYAIALVFCLIAGFIIGLADSNLQRQDETLLSGTKELIAKDDIDGSAKPKNEPESPISGRSTGDASSSTGGTNGKGESLTHLKEEGTSTTGTGGTGENDDEAVMVFSKKDEPLVVTHVVSKGETLSMISRIYGTDPKSLAFINRLADPDVISVGQELKVLTRPGVFYVVKPGDTLWSLCLEHQAEVSDVSMINGISDPDSISPGDIILLPRTMPQDGRAGRNAFIASISRESRLDLSSFIWPLQGAITSAFGQRWGRLHCGIDIGAPVGKQVVATKSGRVTYGGWYGNYGKTVILEHEGGVTTVHAHLSSVSVKKGEVVRQGQVIGRVGDTGSSSGPHLHFEIRTHGRPVDPVNFLP